MELSADQATILLKKNLANIIRKSNAGKTLTKLELSILKKYTDPEKEPEADPLSLVDWDLVKQDYISGVKIQKILDKHGIKIHHLNFRAYRRGWAKIKRIQKNKKNEMIQKEADAALEDYRNEVKEFLKAEYADSLTAIQKANGAMEASNSKDVLQVKTAIEGRLKAHEFGRKALNIDEKLTVEHKGNIESTSMLEALQCVKELVGNKKFDPRTIDIDSIAQQELEEG